MRFTPPPANAVHRVKRALDAIDRHENKLHAVAQRIDDIALADAHRCDALAAAASTAGPLHGVPFVIKDIIDIAGVPTRSGSLTRADNPAATRDAPVVSRLRAAGAVPLVKSNTVEFASGGWGTNANIGTPWNPWDLENHRIPGGSSSGTGVLVGSGIVDAGLGTDTGGSVRLPASFCGCVGLKTSIGLISRSGVTPLSPTLDTVGPLTRTVELAALMLEAMQGQDINDATTRESPGPIDLSDLQRGNQGLRIGFIAADAMPGLSDDVRTSYESALRMLEQSGASVVACELPHTPPGYQDIGKHLSICESYTTYRDLIEDDSSRLNDVVRARMSVGKTVSAADLINLHRERDRAIADFDAAIDAFDAIVMPTTPITAPLLDGLDETDGIVGSNTRMANYLELCALAIPIDLTPAGLPTSLQIVGRRFSDALVLRIGAAFEKVRGDFSVPSDLSAP